CPALDSFSRRTDPGRPSDSGGRRHPHIATSIGGGTLMRFIDIQKMAVHALGKNKIQTALTMLGIVIGVSAVIAMVSLGQGAQKLVEDQVAGMGTNVLQIQGGNGQFTGGARQGADQGQSLTEGDVAAIAQLPP